MYHSLLYISKSTLPASSADDMVRQIATAAEQANSQIGLSGALIFTGTHFVQILEGERADIDKLMAVIERDPRHTDLRIVERKSIAKRSFSTWNMAYMGPSKFVARHVKQLVEHTTGSRSWRAADWIHDLMVEFERAA